MTTELLQAGVVSEAEMINAQRFYEAASAQYDRVVYGEKDAKDALLVGMVARTSILLAGAPGGAKSLLSKNFYRIYADVDSSDVAVIPADAQLTATQLIGGSMPIERTEKDEHGNVKTIVQTNTVNGIVHAGTKFLWGDEATREAPHARNAVLSVPEEKVIRNTTGEIELPDFQMAALTMNPSETKEATFKLSSADISRQMVGALMGHDVTEDQELLLLQGILPVHTYGPIEAVSTLAAVDAIRATVDKVMIPKTEAVKLHRMVKAAKVVLKDEFNHSEENRIFLQAGKVAKIVGLFNNRAANDEDTRTAMRLLMGSRIGALVARNPYVVLTQSLDTIYNKA